MKCEVCKKERSKGEMEICGPEFHFIKGIKVRACRKCRYIGWEISVVAKRKRDIPRISYK